MYCGQTTGWIKIPLGTEVGLGPGDSVLEGTQLLPHGKGHGMMVTMMIGGQLLVTVAQKWELFLTSGVKVNEQYCWDIL